MTNRERSSYLELTDSKKLTIIISLISLCCGIATWSLTKTSDVAYRLGEMNKQVQINTDKLNVGKRFTWEDGVVLENRFSNKLNENKIDYISRLNDHESRASLKFSELETRTRTGFAELKQQMLRFENKMDDYFLNHDKSKE